MKSLNITLLSMVVFLTLSGLAWADPIRKITGAIVEIEEGYVWVVPDGQTDPLKFVLKWKVRFRPPRLPIKGDRAVLLYKNKDEGRVIYGVNYLRMSTEPAKYD